MTEQKHEIRRLFFGWEVGAPWPDKYPSGRLLDESHRHMTLAFLGNVDYQKIIEILPSYPKPSFNIGLVGHFNQCLFLPPRNPRVVAWHIKWNDHDLMGQYQHTLVQWLQAHGFKMDSREFLPHVTLCRSPFVERKWKEAFTPLPCLMKDIHLYESMGNLQYLSRWKHSLKLPFEELEHTADIAFRIRGETMQKLHLNAQYALAFQFPALLPYLDSTQEISSLDQSITALNGIVGKADGEIGCPFKAVSFHGEVVHEQDNTLQWEMIVDV